MPADIGEPKFPRTQRTNAADRLERVMNAKQRMIGVDVEYLKKQVEEKKAEQNASLESESKYLGLANKLDDRLVLLEQERREVQRKVNAECQAHWANEGQKHNRKEYDLSRPDLLKQETPARVGDDDPRLGPASMQTFRGEDLGAGERKKMQCAQQSSWWSQQVLEKQEHEQQEREEDKDYMALNIAQAEQSYRVDAASVDVRRKMNLKANQINHQLVEQRAQKALTDKQEELNANNTDMYNTFNSALLAEHPATGIHAFDPCRRRPDHFKGLLPDEKQRILDYQAAQRDDMKARAEEERKENVAHAQYVERVRKEQCRKAAELDTFRKEQRMAVTETLKKQQSEKVKRDSAMKDLYTNVPNSRYYEQFGTSHR